eukprot:sb/3472808/
MLSRLFGETWLCDCLQSQMSDPNQTKPNPGRLDPYGTLAQMEFFEKELIPVNRVGKMKSKSEHFWDLIRSKEELIMNRSVEKYFKKNLRVSRLNCGPHLENWNCCLVQCSRKIVYLIASSITFGHPFQYPRVLLSLYSHTGPVTDSYVSTECFMKEQSVA